MVVIFMVVVVVVVVVVVIEGINLCEHVSSSFVSCEGFQGLLQEGVTKAQNASFWNESLQKANAAMCNKDWERLRSAVSRLFKTLEVTLNKSDNVSQDLAAFICSKIMMTVVHKNLGAMSFNMVLEDGKKFTSKIRYKPQGTGIHKRDECNLVKTAKRRSRQGSLFISLVDPC